MVMALVAVRSSAPIPRCGRHQGKDYSYGVAAEASTTQYANPLAVPALSGKVILRGTYGDDAANVAATTTIADTNTYNLRSSDLIQSLKGSKVRRHQAVHDSRRRAVVTQSDQRDFQDFLTPQVYLHAAHSFRALRM
jgi:hypothetical protein